LLFNFDLEYAIGKVQANQKRMEMNGTHQLLVYANDVNMLRGNINTVKTNTEALVNASNEVDLEVNTEKTKHMVVYRRRNARQNHSLLITNKSFENVANYSTWEQQ
jgi:hypothetical protein